jgi:hypothetical protein
MEQSLNPINNMEQLLIPINNKKDKENKCYRKWVNDNLDNLKDVYTMIKNYDNNINFLDECEFSLFCSFAYDNSYITRIKTV